METSNNESLKISIKYSENSHAWNNFINFLISFMIDNNILSEFDDDDTR